MQHRTGLSGELEVLREDTQSWKMNFIHACLQGLQGTHRGSKRVCDSCDNVWVACVNVAVSTG